MSPVTCHMSPTATATDPPSANGRTEMFTELAFSQIQSKSHNVRMLLVLSVGKWNCMDWKLLIQECIAEIAKLKTLFWKVSLIFWGV